ncbi:hypothetical protein [Sedimentitalea sp. HM32M-2]
MPPIICTCATGVPKLQVKATPRPAAWVTLSKTVSGKPRIDAAS